MTKPSVPTRLIPYAATAVFGVGTGAVLVTFLSSAPPSHSRSVVGPASATAELARAGPEELGAIRSRLARLEQRAVAPPAPSADVEERDVDPEPPAGAVPRPTPEAGRQRVLASIEKRQRAYDSEARDPSWSSEATAKIEAGLTASSTRADYTIAHVDCRTSVCRAAVRWKSYSDASKHWQELVHADTGMDCESSAFVPMPDNWDEPYESLAFYDCTDERAK